MFCHWFLQQYGTNPNFHASMEFMDAEQFARDGSRIFIISICGKMRFFHHITDSSSSSISEPVFVVIFNRTLCTSKEAYKVEL
jgi:hypothetical protein